MISNYYASNQNIKNNTPSIPEKYYEQSNTSPKSTMNNLIKTGYLGKSTCMNNLIKTEYLNAPNQRYISNFLELKYFAKLTRIVMCDLLLNTTIKFRE